MMNKNYIILTAITSLFLISSLFYLSGVTNDFDKRLEYISERYPTAESPVPWQDYPKYIEEKCENGSAIWKGSLQVDSWNTLKAYLRNDHRHPNEILYDKHAFVIWSNVYGYEYVESRDANVLALSTVYIICK